MKKYVYLRICRSTLLIIVSITIIMSCGRKEIASPMIISINEYQNVVPSELFIERIDSILISNKDHGYISTVEDVCAGDSSIYVLDTSAKLIKINHLTGQVEISKSLRGHSVSECVMPKAVANNKDSVFVLDMSGMKILILDNYLNYINSVRIPVPAMDFAIIPEGFLLYNLNAKENDGIIMSITNDGQLKDNYIPSDGIPDLILSQHLFTETEKGILTLPPMRNELYEYNFKNDSVNCQYKYEFSNMKSVSEGHESLPDIQNAVILAFETERYLISNFYFNQIIGTCVHDKRKNVTTSGLLKTDLPYPFTPMTSKDGILFSLCERSYISEDSPRYIILKYYLKK